MGKYVDLVTPEIRELLTEYTTGTIEEYISQARKKAEAANRIKECHKRLIADFGEKDFRERILPNLPRKDETDKPEYWERFAVNVAHWVGGERGMRIGAEAAERMILEARSYASNQVRNFAPLLNDVEPVDG